MRIQLTPLKEAFLLKVKTILAAKTSGSYKVALLKAEVKKYLRCRSNKQMALIDDANETKRCIMSSCHISPTQKERMCAQIDSMIREYEEELSIINAAAAEQDRRMMKQQLL